MIRWLFSDHFACLVRQDHEEVNGNALRLRTYLSLRHLLISPTSGGQSVVDTTLAQHGCARRVAAQVASFMLAPQLVAQSDLVLTAPASSLAQAEQFLPVRIVRAPVELPELYIAAYWNARRGNDPLLLWLVGVVENAVASAGLSSPSYS
jgi:DNA-binding transcriptional LysR family regulator